MESAKETSSEVKGSEYSTKTKHERLLRYIKEQIDNERIPTITEDLMLSALSLSEMIESGTKIEVPRADGGRPLRKVQLITEDAIEYIISLQSSAKIVADELLRIHWELSNINLLKD